MGSKLEGPVSVGGWRLWVGPGSSTGPTRELLRAALRHLTAADAAKRGRRKALYTDLRHDGHRYLLKYHRYDTRLRFRRRSKSRRELQAAVEVAARDIPAAIPTAAAEQWKGGRLAACLLIVPEEAGARDLAALWRDATIGYARRLRWASDWGRLARRMHAAGIAQEDFAPNNFLATPKQFVAIDFERTRVRRRPLHRSECCAALAKLQRYLADASRPLCFRFLLSYSGGSRLGARRLWRDVESELPRLLRRDIAHLARRAGQSGRRFAVHDLPPVRNGWRCLARRGFALRDAVALLESRDLAGAPPATVAWGDYWVRTFPPLAARTRRHVWATVQGLGQRHGLCAVPEALVYSERGSALLYRREPRSELARDSEHASVRLLRRRLASLGLQSGQIPLDAIVLLEPATHGPRARLLAPGALDEVRYR